MKKILLSVGILLFAIPLSLLGQYGWIKNIYSPNKITPQTMVKTSDGHFVFDVMAQDGLGSGLEADHYLIKITKDENILWTRPLNYTYPDLFKKIIATNDNGILAISLKLLSANGQYQFHPYLTKLNENGEEEWGDFYSLNDTTIKHQIGDIITTADEGYLIAEKIDTTNAALVIKKLDADFNEEWSITKPSDYNISNAINNTSFSLVELDNGDFGIAGVKEGSSNNIGFVLKLTPNGNELWETTITDFNNYSFLTGLPDGALFLTIIDNSGTSRGVKIDTNGNILWSKILITTNSSNNPTPPIFAPTSVSDGIIFSSLFADIVSSVQIADVIIKKIDFDGESIWENRIDFAPSQSVELCLGLVALEDDGVMGTVGHFSNKAETFIFRTDSLGRIYPNNITGQVSIEEQPNCLVDSLEEKPFGWMVSAKNDEHAFYSLTDTAGNYNISLDTGDYVLSIRPPSEVWSPCENDIEISVAQDSTITQDFPIEILTECPWLVVSTALPIARPCFDNNRYHINYCNVGSADAEDAYIEINIDENLTYQSSSIDLALQNGNTYTFELGNIPFGDCGTFYVDFLLDCETTLGENICISSHIYPDTFCLPPDPNWNGAFVEVDIDCQDSLIQFNVENIGTGDMLNPKEYIVIEDAILLIASPFQLLAGETNSFTLPNNGSTFTMIAEQVEDAPGDPYPTAWVEGCGSPPSGNFNYGFLNQFSLGDNVSYLDRDCAIATGSFDPNDKQGFPNGYADEHFIRPNTDLEYLIRFQNTGTDTAFTVVIRDTIASELDIPSIQVGASSHPYSWRIYGENVLEFTFNTIMLPDSNVNEPASHGFVEFKISQKEDLPLGTVINNKAAIYFDHNDPIITNQTYHTLGENFITVSLQRPTVEDYSLKVRPNPLQDFAIFEMKKEIRDGFFELYDVNGKQVWQQKFNGKQFELHRNNQLNSGIYFYKISEKGNAINSGKIIVN